MYRFKALFFQHRIEIHVHADLLVEYGEKMHLINDASTHMAAMNNAIHVYKIRLEASFFASQIFLLRNLTSPLRFQKRSQ